jgi:hypothetical protein
MDLTRAASARRAAATKSADGGGTRGSTLRGGTPVWFPPGEDPPTQPDASGGKWVPTTGPDGQPHDEQTKRDDDDEPTGPTGPNPGANADMLDAQYKADPDAMKASNPSLAYYIGHDDHNEDGSG